MRISPNVIYICTKNLYKQLKRTIELKTQVIIEKTIVQIIFNGYYIIQCNNLIVSIDLYNEF